MTTWDVVSATGHRPQHLTPAEIEWAKGEAPRIVAKLHVEYGMTTGASGLAIGWDTWWGAALVSAEVALWAHIPFPQQPDVWKKPADRAEWHRLRAAAEPNVTVYGDLSGVPAADRKRRAVTLLHERNDGMLDVSRAVVALHKRSKTSGGTASAVRKAVRRGLPVIHLDPERRTVTLRSPNFAPAGATPTA